MYIGACRAQCNRAGRRPQCRPGRRPRLIIRLTRDAAEKRRGERRLHDNARARAFAAAFGISCMQLRQWCDAAHELGAWNTCGSKDFYYGPIGVYCIATTSKKRWETTGIVGLLKEMTL